MGTEIWTISNLKSITFILPGTQKRDEPRGEIEALRVIYAINSRLTLLFCD